jgi:lipoic acid synthetase
MEPVRTAIAVKKMNLRHVVITSVDRDDIKEDYGATIWAETIKQIHHHVVDCTVEVLTPDFKGDESALLKVFSSQPEIFSHNVECVERISKNVRNQADWKRSLQVLRFAVKEGMHTKTGMMVGLGEKKNEVIDTMKQVAELGVSIFTIGQYLQPTKKHLPVDRYVSDEEFVNYKSIGYELGFSVVESGSLVRSSYHADEQARLFNTKSEKLV